MDELDETFAMRMQQWVECGDPEIGHGEADDLLCELLIQLGYEKTVAAYHKVDKWFA